MNWTEALRNCSVGACGPRAHSSTSALFFRRVKARTAPGSERLDRCSTATLAHACPSDDRADKDALLNRPVWGFGDCAGLGAWARLNVRAARTQQPRNEPARTHVLRWSVSVVLSGLYDRLRRVLAALRRGAGLRDAGGAHAALRRGRPPASVRAACVCAARAAFCCAVAPERVLLLFAPSS